MIDIHERLLAAFDVEYREHLEAIRGHMAEFARRQDGSGIAFLDETFRHAHSLKGAARAVDLAPVERLAHKLETLFARLRAGRLGMDDPVPARIGRVLDAVEDWVTAHRAGRPTPDLDPVGAELEALFAEGEEPAPPPAPAPAPAPPAAAPVRSRDETVRIRSVHLDHLLRTSNELLTEAMNLREVTEGLADIDRGLAELEGEWRRVRKRAGESARHGDAMEQMLRRLVRRTRQSRRRQQRTGWALRRLGGELQAQVRDARMVPAEMVFAGFRKMVRDLAADTGRSVDIDVTGLDVEADRMVMQGLKDPVMHLLRNALAHGVEPPAERAGAGKPPVARIRLDFAIADGRLAVTVEDDGRGIDFDAVRARAGGEGLDRQGLIDRLFDPGFSTRTASDDLAGRGMGLSVVREAVAMMNGTVEVDQCHPCGTRFRLSLPLSVSTQRLFLAGCRGHVYGLPTAGIDRLYRIPTAAVKTVEGRSAVQLDGHHMPLLALGQLLGLSETAVKISRAILPVVVIKYGERRVAIAVDDFHSIREGLVQDIGVPAARGTMVAGGLLLENGSVALVLNPFEIVESVRRSGAAAALTTIERTGEKRPPVILVVDDSLTTRTLEKSILEAHGYQVRLAVDGIEALAKLRAESADLVISDVQMPRLDGFGLLQAIKGDPALARIPVVLVTSLEAREDRERGLALGADAYVAKRKFDQKDLLETIGQIL